MFAERTHWDFTRNRLTEALDLHRAAGKPLLDLTVSNPTTCGFHFNAPQILAALSNPAALNYQPDPRGLESARRAVSACYAARGNEIAVDDIFLTTSTSEAYSFIFRALCNPGDEILVPEPGYPLFGFLAGIQDVAVVRYPLVYEPHSAGGWLIDFHALESAISPRTRAIIVVHPNNPTGQFTKPHEAARLNEFCAARQIALIVDEVFLDFSLAGETPHSFCSNSAALTFTLSGLSKIAGLPQMKAAWLIVSGPDHLKSQALERLEIISDTYLSMNVPVQLALPAFLEQRHEFQSEVVARARENLTELDRQLLQHRSCTRLRVEGGWYAILRIPAPRPDEDIAIDLLTGRNVYVHPGHFYDFPSDGFLVVSLLTPPQDFAEGIVRLLALF